jgi:hypothetical protein
MGSALMFGLFYPQLQYYGAWMLLFEISTIFLDIHWFCDKFNTKFPLFQLVNGIMLMSSFGLVRVVFGSIQIFNCIILGYASLD